MEELQEATRQYLSCADPTEAAARRLRVQARDAQGQMEEAVARILAANAEQQHVQENHIESIRQQMRSPQTINPPEAIRTKGTPNDQIEVESEQRTLPEEEEAHLPPRRRGRPARLRSTVVSPKVLARVSLRQRNSQESDHLLREKALNSQEAELKQQAKGRLTAAEIHRSD